MIENGHLKQIQLLVRNRMFLSDSSIFFVVFCTLLYLYYRFHLFLAKSPCNLYFVIITRLFFLAIKRVLNFYFKLSVYMCRGGVCMWIQVTVEVRGVRSQELVLPLVVSHQMCMLGNELRSSAESSLQLFFFGILLDCF